MNPRFFASQAAFRRWLDQHHREVRELWVGFYRKESGKGGITYREALDEALCFGWIDGLRKAVDGSSYAIRFTPRKADSIWSAVNTRRVEELIKLGRMQTPGLTAFKTRDVKKSQRILTRETTAGSSPRRKTSSRRTQRPGSSFVHKLRGISGRRPGGSSAPSGKRHA
jgi:uncharacterized protein YdeI (YjbR/CyaY-like superfamily)